MREVLWAHADLDLLLEASQHLTRRRVDIASRADQQTREAKLAASRAKPIHRVLDNPDDRGWPTRRARVCFFRQGFNVT